MPPADRFELVADGRLHLSGAFLGPSHYCVEECDISGMHVAVVCIDGRRFKCGFFRELLYTVAMCVSALGLALTLAVYLAIAELRNAPGKNLVCLASALLLAYVVLVASRLLSSHNRGSHNKWVCTAAGRFFDLFSCMHLHLHVVRLHSG